MVFDADPRLKNPEPVLPSEPQAAGLSTDISARCKALGITKIDIDIPQIGKDMGYLIFLRNDTDNSLPKTTSENISFYASSYEHLVYAVGVDYLSFLAEEGFNEPTTISPFDWRQNHESGLPLLTESEKIGAVSIHNGTLQLEQTKPLNETEARIMELRSKVEWYLLNQDELKEEDEVEWAMVEDELSGLESLLQKYAKKFGTVDPSGFITL